MKRLFLIALLALPVSLFAGDAWFQGSFDDALAAAAKADKDLYLKFYTDW